MSELSPFDAVLEEDTRRVLQSGTDRLLFLLRHHARAGHITAHGIQRHSQAA